MAQTIRAALARIKTLEEGLSLTVAGGDPVDKEIKRVYMYFPRQSAMPEAPCFMHSYALQNVEHPPQMRKQLYVVRAQFWCGDADQDQAADIASAFLAKWLDALSADLTLNGTVSGPIRVRGGDPTLAVLQYANLASVGLDLFIDVQMGPEAVTVGP